MFTQETGWMLKPMDLEHITIKMVQSMKDSGKKINNMEKALKHGQMEKNTMGIIYMV